MRVEDDRSLPSDVHHWLSKLDQEIVGLRTGLTDLTHDVNSNRIVLAELSGKSGRVPVSLIIATMGILLTLAVQTSLAMNWGGRMQGLVEHVITDSGKALSLIEQHIVTAGPVREAIPRLDRDLDSLQKQMNECSNRQSLVIQRLEQIEARNKIADSNWDKLKTKGFLVDRPNQTRSER